MSENLGSVAEPIYAPPSGSPLGTNNYFKYAAAIVIPILKLVTKRDWRGVENIPRSGAVIVVSNHISYADPLVFAHFLFANGRAPRFLGKASVFRIPIIGKIIAGSGQIPVERESSNASNALLHAVAFLKAGHCLGVYPEGTLTRDQGYWPMVGKTGIARLAIMTQATVIPCAQWGAQELLPAYGKLPRIWRRTKVTVIAGAPLDFSKWIGKAEDQAALVEATEYVMSELTAMVARIRGEEAPKVRFDPHSSDLPKTGNYKKGKH
ncbi:MAG: lysophospholipid acyltransferase family protein [Actinomycetes bacterium]